MFYKLVLFLLGISALLLPAAPSLQDKDAPKGDYLGNVDLRLASGTRLKINLNVAPSSNPAQMTVSGRGLYGPNDPSIEFRGTYYVKQLRLSAFGEIRGSESRFNLTLDGDWSSGANNFAARIKLQNVTEGVTDETPIFYLTPGKADTTKLSIDLAPNKATPGQVVTGRGSVDVSGSKPQKLSITGSLSYMVSQGASWRVPSANTVVLDAPANGKVSFDLASLGVTLVPGVEDPKLNVTVAAADTNAMQTARLEYDQAPEPVNYSEVVVRPKGETKTGKPVFIKLVYRLRNRGAEALRVNATEKVWVTEPDGTKTELPGQSREYVVPPGSFETNDTLAEPEFKFTPKQPGKYRIDYELWGIHTIQFRGFITIDVSGVTPSRQEQKGDLRGSIQLDRGSTMVSDPVNVTLNYSLSGRSSAEVNELVELVGPSGSVVASSSKARNLMEGEASTRRWVLNAAEPGAYQLRAKISGSDVTTFQSETALTVKPREEAGGGTTGGDTKPPKVEGTYGLVKKEPGFAPGDGVEPYGTWTGSFGDGSFQCTWTATRDYQGSYTFKASYSSPPSVLKPGDIVELTTSAQASRSSDNQPGHGAGAKWYVEGAEVLEATSAFSGSASDGKFYSSAQGKTRFKVGTGGTIRLIAGQGHVFGNGIKAPVYIYQWNSPPVVDPGPTDPDKDKKIVNRQTGLYPAGGDDEEEEGPITAFIQPTSITLRAGEMSEIVNVHISNFRKRTEDRVEVIFPEKTDNWASLPGGIVVTGGDGSYWPPNMGRPEHVDGYFFRARSNAPSGKKTVTIIVRQAKAGEVRLTLDVTVIGKGSSGPPTAASWAGAWSSNFDDMVLTQDGDKVSGFFGVDRYAVRGTASGRVFTFKIFDGKDEFGSGKLTLSEDGKTFEGTLTVAGNDPMEWKGKRVG